MALEPITRQEKIIAGQDLTPITRMEMFLKNFGGGGGGSVPKPLTYDYMPEGYPSKTNIEITWDGDPTDRPSAAGGYYYIGTHEEVYNASGTVKVRISENGVVSDEELAEENIIKSNSGFVIYAGYAIYCYDASETLYGFSFPCTGLFFVNMGELFISKLEITDITPMAEEFLPDTATKVEYANVALLSELAENLTSGKTVYYKSAITSGKIISFDGDMVTSISLVFDSNPFVKYTYSTDNKGKIYFDQYTSAEATNTALYLKSSTADSTKKFKITVDDSGTISATEVT